MNARYLVTIKWACGNVTRATVSRKTLCGFKLSACRGASVSIFKVNS